MSTTTSLMNQRMKMNVLVFATESRGPLLSVKLSQKMTVKTKDLEKLRNRIQIQMLILGRETPKLKTLLFLKKPSIMKMKIISQSIWIFIRQPQSKPGNSNRMVPPPPPPREGQWQREKKRPPQTLEQRYADKKDCVVVKHIPSCYNVVNHLTKYFQR